ncbi:cytochrome c3 family protein [Inmirania thermothiophila]|uniref:Doubled CXXCH motif protein n=1 Tax=Inmirania thermothiophila TaxID=1750597 RepID=A0A3N1Y664_9GAMM|nr:cytochrome c3 family protein [Inmirania thermothiophila]ROR34306.1 doubled CXXCH motif protein [Inmirania thermothiophila]
MRTGRRNVVVVAAAAAVLVAAGIARGATAFTNQGGIVNTRHNLAQSTIPAKNAMDPYRNDYGEVCVYCHTPHGSNSRLDAPLWNRTFNGNTYTTYDTLGTATLTSDVQQPGINSLTCLSCHDGTVAVDSIINMPGSGRYSATQETSQDGAFLDAWAGSGIGTASALHWTLNADTSKGFAEDSSCLVCHSTSGFVPSAPFDVFAIGTDLTNDHPVGIALPASRIGVDFFDPSGSFRGMRFYDKDGDGRPDSNEVRFYPDGSGTVRVECASCHDPHGVPSTGNFGDTINPTFLRVNNQGSQLCLTCHNF